MTADLDPGDEIEDKVSRIIGEHTALWGCDDPMCAVLSSALMTDPPSVSWFRRIFTRQK